MPTSPLLSKTGQHWQKWGLRNWSKAADMEETLTQEKLLFLSLSSRMLVMLGMRGQ